MKYRILSHAPMEPLNCTAQVRADGVDVWMGTQNPDMALQLAARAAGVAPEKVQIHTCFLGGGFGRRAMNDELVQAVTVAKAVGKPVKLLWTREIDIRHDRYRPQAALRCRASLAADGSLNGLHIQTAVGSITRSLGWGTAAGGVEPQAVEGLANQPYAVANQRVECVLKNTHIPVMFWRSVGSSQNAFVVESFIDELAHAAGQDAYQFRRKLLAHRPDFVRVLDTAAQKGDWGKPLPTGTGRGIAIHRIVRHHRGAGGRSRGQPARRGQSAARGRRGGLRPCGQSSVGGDADRKRCDLRPDRGAVRRDHDQERRGGAG